MDTTRRACRLHPDERKREARRNRTRLVRPPSRRTFGTRSPKSRRRTGSATAEAEWARSQNCRRFAACSSRRALLESPAKQSPAANTKLPETPVSPPRRRPDRNAPTSAQVTPPHPHSPQPPSRDLNPNPLPRSPSSPRKTISVRKEPRRSTPPLWLSARSPAPSDVPRRDPATNPGSPADPGRQPRNPF